jgi:hypothetical protein
MDSQAHLRLVHDVTYSQPSQASDLVAPAVRADKFLVAAAVEAMPTFAGADASLTSVRYFCSLQNQRSFCSRLRSALLVECLGMQMRSTPSPSQQPPSGRNRMQHPPQPGAARGPSGRPELCRTVRSNRVLRTSAPVTGNLPTSCGGRRSRNDAIRLIRRNCMFCAVCIGAGEPFSRVT